MLSTRNVHYRYGSGTVLRYPDLNMTNERVYVMLGSSGSGKSTWLQLVAGLRSLEQNTEIVLDGAPLHSLSSVERDQHRAQHMGIIYQEPVFIEAISVLDNLLLAQRLATGSEDKNRALQLVDSLDLLNEINRKPRQLSTGQRQRAAIARALIHSPQLIIADEPSSALDDLRTVDLNNILRDQAQEHNAILVIITHDRRMIRSEDLIIEINKIQPA